MLLFQAEQDLSQCVDVELSMLLFQSELDLSQCVAVAECVAVSVGAGPVTVCCCC